MRLCFGRECKLKYHEYLSVFVCLGSEILRVIDSLQLTDRLKVVATPANWTVSHINLN